MKFTIHSPLSFIIPRNLDVTDNQRAYFGGNLTFTRLHLIKGSAPGKKQWQIIYAPLESNCRDSKDFRNFNGTVLQ